MSLPIAASSTLVSSSSGKKLFSIWRRPIANLRPIRPNWTNESRSLASRLHGGQGRQVRGERGGVKAFHRQREQAEHRRPESNRAAGAVHGHRHANHLALV